MIARGKTSTIPLDKRLAADGRGLKDHSISEKFATLSESLYETERAARTEVRLRAQVQQKLAMPEKDQREGELRVLANQARMERGGGGGISTSHNPIINKEATTTTAAASTRVAPPGHSEESDDDESAGSHRHDDEIEDSVAARQREQMRIERKRQREKEMRMDKNMELKKKKLEEDRDVSEKIALGVHTGNWNWWTWWRCGFEVVQLVGWHGLWLWRRGRIQYLLQASLW
jgi:SNW domain-containing protein 1